MSGPLDRLARGGTLIADGGIGTLLLARLEDPGACPEAINLTRPDILTGIAADYAAAGAEMVTTNTFGATASKLAAHGRAGEAEAINRAGVAAARSAVADSGALVAGSMGPTGRLLLPYGDAEEAELSEDFERQAAALADAGADLLVIETMQDLREARLAVSAARRAAGALPVAATLTFQKTPRGFFTLMGDAIAAAAEALVAAGADIVGSNCGNGIDVMGEIAAEFRRVCEHPLLLQANAGLPDASGGAVTYAETPDMWAEGAVRILRGGGCIVGGCCGTTPRHIARLRDLARES